MDSVEDHKGNVDYEDCRDSGQCGKAWQSNLLP